MQVRFEGITIGQSVETGNEIDVTEADLGYPEMRTSDVVREARDGTMPGRDYFGTRTMQLDLMTKRGTMAEARESVAEFVAAWRSSAHRLQAGMLVPLEYRTADVPEWRRVLGRPRRISDPTPDVQMRYGAARLSAQFDVMNPLVFSGGEPGLHEVTLRQAPTTVTGGWTWPRDPAWPVVGESLSGAREGSLSVGGTEPTPVTVTFHGPGSQFVVRGSRGWRVALRSGVTLAHDESITIDPLSRRVYDNFGRPRFGDLQTRLLAVEISPGVENCFFAAADPSLSASATVSWRDAFSSLA